MITFIHDNFVRILFGVLSIIFAGQALFLLFKEANALGRATLAAALFVFCALIGNTDQFDSFTFSATGVVAKAKNVIEQAQVTIGNLRMLSVASAKAIYLNLAWSNRLGGIEPRQKQKALDSINEQLRTVEVSDADWQAIVWPHVELIGYDLYFIFYYAARSAVSYHVDELQTRDHKTQADTFAILQTWDAKWTPTSLVPLDPFLTEGARLTSYMKQQVSPSLVEPPAYDKLMKLAETVGTLYEACRKHGGYTDETLVYLEEYNKGNNGELGGYYAKLMALP